MTRRASWPFAGACLATLAITLAVFAGAAPTASAACPNEAIRQEQGVTNLPDCMALEMVSPPAKSNYRAGEPTNPTSISTDGDRVQFQSPAPLAETEGVLNALGDSYVATRGSSGWATSPTSPPASSGYGWGGATTAAFPLSYTPDYGSWLSLQNTVTQAQNGQMTAYEADLGGTWTPRSKLLTPLDGHHGLQLIREVGAGHVLTASSPDFSHIFLRPADAFENDSTGQIAMNGYSGTYVLGDPQPRRIASSIGAASWNTYVLTRGPLGEQREPALMARETSTQKAWGGNCGAFVGGGGGEGIRGGRNQGAVSVDGTSVIFSTRPLEPQAYAENPTYPRCAESATVSFAAGTATIAGVVTAKSTGTTSTATEPEVITGVSVSAGAFAVGQTVTLTGSTIVAGTTVTAVESESEGLWRITLSNPVTANPGTGKELKAGAAPLAVGEEITATTTCTIPSSGPCFAQGTTITAVSGQTITVSPEPLRTGPAKTIVAVPPLRIMHRTEAPNGEASISELVPGAPAAGSDFFEGASVDQKRIYFTSSRKLTASDLDPTAEECTAEVKLPTVTSQGCDLYLYEELSSGGHELIQVSSGGVGDPTPGEGADVIKGVVAISNDGTHVYYAAEGVLTAEPNSEGAVAQAGHLNLYLYERDAAHPSGRTAFIGELDSACTKVESKGQDCGPESGGSLVGRPISYWNNATAAGLGGEGDILVFESTAPLTADDKDGKHLDVFRYDAGAETLQCVSCLPGAVGDAGAFDVTPRSTPTVAGPGPEHAEHQSWVTEDGGGIVFTTAEQLLPEAVNGKMSDYLWQNGQLTLLPGTGTRPSISHTGEEVAFETAAPLLPQDIDTAVDVYVARANGGFPSPSPPPPPCTGEACQGPLSPAPATQSPGSQNPSGGGNLKPKQQTKKHHKKKHQKKTKKRHSSRAGSEKKGGRK